MALISSTCTQCGQTDDHPKVVLADNVGGSDVRYHHDCLPHALKLEVSQSPQGKAAIDAAESGTRGDDLRTAILDAHKES